ncbi:MAG: hypothetical protein ACI9HK_001037 [Pirellulaceae bacterium]|jgi:hypothetical protein
MTISAQDTAEFETALKEYKKKHGRMFPTCSEILEVARAIGYNKPDSEYTEEEFIGGLDEENEFGEFESESESDEESE